MTAPRVVRDGQVAVLYSPGFGAGWSTWAHNDAAREAMMFCPELVEAVERKATATDLVAIAKRIFPEEYEGGVAQLKIAWLPAGTSFQVSEYDGSESIRERDGEDWSVA